MSRDRAEDERYATYDRTWNTDRINVRIKKKKRKTTKHVLLAFVVSRITFPSFRRSTDSRFRFVRMFPSFVRLARVLERIVNVSLVQLGEDRVVSQCFRYKKKKMRKE